jgi:hypothetical protein
LRESDSIRVFPNTENQIGRLAAMNGGGHFVAKPAVCARKVVKKDTSGYRGRRRRRADRHQQSAGAGGRDLEHFQVTQNVVAAAR